MTLIDLLELPDLIRSNTRITIKLGEHEDVPVAAGNWYQDQIMNYSDRMVYEFNMNVRENKLVLSVSGDIYLW